MAEDDGGTDDGGRRGSLLRRQVGPFTVGAWSVIVVGGVGLGLVIRRSSLFDGADAAPIDAGGATPTVEGSTGWTATGGPYAGATGSLPAGSSTTANPNDPRKAADNLTWQRLTGDQLIAGGQVPSLVSTALTNFLGGYPVTRQERAVIDLAIRLGGQPPEGAPPITMADETPAPTVPISTDPQPQSNPQGAPSTPASTPSANPVATPAQLATLNTAYSDVVGRLNSANPGDIVLLGNQAAWFNIRTGDDGPIAKTPAGNRNAYYLALRYGQMGRNDLITPRTN